LTTKDNPLSHPSRKSVESKTRIDQDIKIFSLTSNPSKALMSNLNHSENISPPNSSKKLTKSPLKPPKKLHLRKKVRMIFTPQAPLKI
jgi:hypothetical protein